MYLRTRNALARIAAAAVGGLITVPLAAKALGLSTHDTAVQLGRLTRGGWLTRARRGLYMVRPLEAESSSGAIADDPWILASQLFRPCYIAGWSAAEHWGLTEQLFRSTFVASASGVRGKRHERLSTEFHVARIDEARLDGVSQVWRGNVRVPVSDAPRTLADALVHPAWVGGVRHLADIMVRYHADPSFDASALLKRMTQVDVGAAWKRLGFLAESLWPNETRVIETAHAHRTAGLIRLDPAISRRGKMSKRWRIWVNAKVTPADGPA